MYNKRTDLKLLNQIFKVLDIFDISKIDSRMIFERTSHIENRNSSDYIDLLHNYCKYVNSDKFTHLGRFAKKMLLLNSLSEGDKFFKNSDFNTDRIDCLKNQIFIVGLPRSGTTNIQNLMIDNYDVWGLEFWELITPYKNKNFLLDKYRRKIRAYLSYYLFLYLVPRINQMHEVKLDSYEECWHFFRTILLCYNNVLQTGFVELESYMDKLDLDSTFMKYKVFLNQYNQNPNDFVVKCPEHMAYIAPISRIFKQSKFIWIHRDPYKSIVSYCSMIESLWFLFFGKVNKQKLGQFLIKRSKYLLNKAIKGRKSLDSNQIVDVSFSNLINHPENVLDIISQTFNIDKKNNSKSNNTNKKRDSFKSNLRYNAEEYGINRELIKQEFREYYLEYSNYIT